MDIKNLHDLFLEAREAYREDAANLIFATLLLLTDAKYGGIDNPMLKGRVLRATLYAPFYNEHIVAKRVAVIKIDDAEFDVSTRHMQPDAVAYFAKWASPFGMIDISHYMGDALISSSFFFYSVKRLPMTPEHLRIIAKAKNAYAELIGKDSMEATKVFQRDALPVLFWSKHE